MFVYFQYAEMRFGRATRIIACIIYLLWMVSFSTFAHASLPTFVRIYAHMSVRLFLAHRRTMFSRWIFVIAHYPSSIVSPSVRGCFFQEAIQKLFKDPNSIKNSGCNDNREIFFFTKKNLKIILVVKNHKAYSFHIWYVTSPSGPTMSVQFYPYGQRGSARGHIGFILSYLQKSSCPNLLYGKIYWSFRNIVQIMPTKSKASSI
jgi:hypothetical protein